MKTKILLVCTVALMLLIWSCRKDAQINPDETETGSPDPQSIAKGLYLANEGNLGSNKASIDYLDFATGVYRKNIYAQVNPEVVNGLGDVANDVAVYGAKLYVVVNASNKVEVMNAKTGKRIGQINILNCRYITFHKGKAYVSAYLGTIGDPNAPQGIVAKIDTTTLQEEQRIEVGRQPEEMAIVGEKMYVANSGGYSVSNYERTIAVVDLNAFRLLKKIDVAINLNRIKADKYGDLYVTSRGDNYETPAKLFVIDTKTETIKKTFNMAVSNLVIDEDNAYFYSNEFSYITGDIILNYGILNVKDEVLTDKKYITDGTDKIIMIPYGIAVNPFTKDVYVTDAKDYVSPGTLYCFDPSGKMKFSVSTGDTPGHFAFYY